MNTYRLKIKSPEGITHYGFIRKERNEWVAVLMSRSFAEGSLSQLKQRLVVEFPGEDIHIKQGSV